MHETKQSVDTPILRRLQDKRLDESSGFWKERFNAINSCDVERAMSKTPGVYDFEKLVTLVSPAAESYLEAMAQAAHRLTVQRFGRTIRLYAPLYLSNYCTNSCRYCGFNREHDFERT